MKHNLFEKCRDVEKKLSPQNYFTIVFKNFVYKNISERGRGSRDVFPRMLCNRHKVPRWLPVM